ncbi:hypothetical protein DPMN_117820 [Dreissena polymorpha]|uniref:Uncharacterized protein n=1 Tax=Dreissena polymorpha TaxID=45954 RepID=A0A9D4JQK1_DREPO|nr:hypothetical protein DPMN_117820 [Dreissena polymorpha]
MTYLEAQNIIGTNLLTKFHEDWKINVASRVLTRKNALPPGSHFHEDRTVNVASRVLTGFYYSHIRKNAPPLGSHFFQANINNNKLEKNAPPLFHDDRNIYVTSRVKIAPHLWGHVFQPTCIIFELVQDIIGMNLLTENVASRVKNAPPLGGHVIHKNVTILEFIQDIIKTNLLTIFHQDLLTRFYYSLIKKNAPPPGGLVFQPTGIIFELVQDIIGMNLLTKKNAPPLGSHVFQAKVTIFELIKDISETNLLSKFHEDRKINVASRVLTRFYYSHVPVRKNASHPGGHVFQPTGIIFELVQDIIGMNLLTKFHEDQTINVASRVKNAPPLGSHVFQANVTIFELIQDIIETNLLTKFHEDWTINVASRE